MKTIFFGLAALLVIFAAENSASANGNRTETRYFSAEIANIRRAQTGNVIVTIKFTAKITDTAKLYVYSDIRKTFDTRDVDCPNNNSVLIDGDGEEHTAQNCLPPFETGGGWDQKYTNGMEIHANSETSFVYKFGLAGTSKEALKNINLIVPMHYNHCSPRTPPFSGYDCAPSPMTLSFYGVSAN